MKSKSGLQVLSPLASKCFRNENKAKQCDCPPQLMSKGFGKTSSFAKYVCRAISVIVACKEIGATHAKCIRVNACTVGGCKGCPCADSNKQECCGTNDVIENTSIHCQIFLISILLSKALFVPASSSASKTLPRNNAGLPFFYSKLKMNCKRGLSCRGGTYLWRVW